MDISFLKPPIYKFLSLLLFVTVSVACNPDLDYTVTGYTQKIIVEGSIETGKYPVVYLSLNVPLWKTLDSATVLEHVIRYAKVTISDGVKTEILTSKWDKTHFPPYVYKATEIMGVEGTSYSLKVEYSGYTVYSNTFLPNGTDIDSVQFQPSTDSDSLGILSVWININKSSETGFRIFTKKQQDKRYIETPVVFNNEFALSGVQKFNLSPRPEITDSSYSEGQYFTTGSIVDIKILALDRISTGFFKDISLFSTSTENMFLNEVKPLNSNISEPGFGIWYGCGTRFYQCVVK